MKELKKKYLGKIFDKSWMKISLILTVAILLIGVIGYVTFGINEEQIEVKSVEIKSDGWDTQEPGSWKIDKSAEWVGYNKAQITFNLETLPKFLEINTKYDVVFALDVSTSMAGEKFVALKESLKKYINEVLVDTDNRIAFTEYHTYGSVLSSFSNDIDELNKVVDNLELKCKGAVIDGIEQDYGYCTNYADGLAKVYDVLDGYVPEEGRQLTVLFLTDGSANRDNGLIKNNYDDLKNKYPDITIHGIQYEMGSKINSYLKLASDDQYDAYVDDIYDKFFVATYAEVLAKYEKFDITDYISDYFYVSSEKDINVNKGTIEFDQENQRILWNVANDIFMSGNRAKMTINANLKEPYSGINGFYPTNKGEDINTQIRMGDYKEEKSSLTPILKNYYTVIYDTNPPKECDIKKITSETHFVYETVRKRTDELTCDGYVFRGWEFTDSSYDVKKIGTDTFIMPEHDVEIKAVWGNVGISKSMEGTLAPAETFLYDVVKEGAVPDNQKSTYVSSSTGINYNLYSSDTNGKGKYLYSDTQYDNYPIYFYRGDVTNNNVIFANFCWKIVRTTDTGGTKLIYNGKVGTGSTCNNTGTASQLLSTSSFNSNDKEEKYIRYMYDRTTSSTIKTYIDEWFKENIKDNEYDSYLEDTVWCNDTNGKEQGTGAYRKNIFYGFILRCWEKKTKPILSCPLKEDSYTTENGNNINGNKLLKYPVALISGDEAQLAGYGEWNTNGTKYNKDSYLYTGQSFWLLSAGGYSTGDTLYRAAAIYHNGMMVNYSVSNKYGVRPSISLIPNATIELKGKGEPGSATNPYIIK